MHDHYIIFLLLRFNAFSILDGVEATITALLTCAISVVISVGKAKTCDSIRKGYEDYFKERYDHSIPYINMKQYNMSYCSVISQ